MPLIKIAFLDVGQGDTIVISCPDTREAIVVDCVDASAVLAYLCQENIRRLCAVIITHLHADHCSEVYQLLSRTNQVPGLGECELLAYNRASRNKHVKALKQDAANILNDADQHSTTGIETPNGSRRQFETALRNLLQWGLQHTDRLADVTVQQRPLPFKGVVGQALELLHPTLGEIDLLEGIGLNNASVVLRVRGEGSSALLMGDLEPRGWDRLCAHHPEMRGDVLKFPHHGAWKDGDAGRLLDEIQPQVVVISVGTEGAEKYQHPNVHVFEAIAARKGIRLLCTQVTSRCTTNPEAHESAMTGLHRSEASTQGRAPMIFRRGCPCAGTVVIELASRPRVVQPTVQFHRDVIIEPHYEKARCRKYPEGQIVGEAGGDGETNSSVDPAN